MKHAVLSSVSPRSCVNPSGEFPRLAAEHSDDDWTADSGGRLGGVRASQLPPEYLDALAALRPGEVSPAFRTLMGFHIVRREPLPPEQQVAGQRVVLRYRGSWSIDGVQPDRTREQALALGRRIHDLAATGRVEFDTLAEQHSRPIHVEHRGAFGLWSTRDPGYFPREVDRLSRLRPGEVSEPIDSPWGIEVLRRREISDQMPVLAVVVVEIPFAPVTPLPEEHAARRAEEICTHSQLNASAFDVAVEEHCCPTTQRWPLDELPDELLGAKLLKIGAVAPSPIKLRHSFAVVRRVSPDFASYPAFDLPSPARADIDAIVANSTGQGLAAELRALAEAVRDLAALSEATRASVADRIVNLAGRVEVESDAFRRRGAVSATWAQIRRELSEADYAAIDAAINDWVKSRILTPQR
ncbi:MAG: peptidylprolyl isomerase [Myxococcales bacterium]|nr:peptidylprolyl isomerase [Myxococcales bacterium]